MDSAKACPGKAHPGPEAAHSAARLRSAERSRGRVPMRNVSRLLLVLSVSVLGATALTAMPAGATFPGHDGKFVYRTMNEVWTVSRAGENPTPIVPNANGAEYPAFSPSGETVFFDANLDGDYDIVSV